MQRGRLAHPYEATRDHGARIDRLERTRPAVQGGGGGITVNIGPGYTSTGPTLMAPGIPDPALTIPHQFTKGPIRGVTIWAKTGAGQYVKYDPATATLTGQTIQANPNLRKLDCPSTTAVGGWVTTMPPNGEGLTTYTNIRDGRVIRQPAQSAPIGDRLERVVYLDNEYLYISNGGSTGAPVRRVPLSAAGGEAEPEWIADTEYHYSRYTAMPTYTRFWVRRRGDRWTMSQLTRGTLIQVAELTTARVAQYMPLNQAAVSATQNGNWLVSRQYASADETLTVLLSGVDGRELGKVPWGVGVTDLPGTMAKKHDSNLIVDHMFQNGQYTTVGDAAGTNWYIDMGQYALGVQNGGLVVPHRTDGTKADPIRAESIIADIDPY